MIKKFQKRPVIIEAEQFVIWDNSKPPQTIIVQGITFPVYNDSTGLYINIPTLEGVMRANNLDWIIKGIKGEIYPCKPDIFESSYQEVNN